MPGSLVSAVPYLLAAGTAVLPGGNSLRHGAVGTAFATLAMLAASRVAGTPASFYTINNVILWSGLLLLAVALAGGWRAGSRLALAPLAVALALTLGTTGAFLREGHPLPSLLGGIAAAAAVIAVPVPRPATPHPTAGSPRSRNSLQRWGAPLLLCILLLPALWLILTIAGVGNWTVQGFRDAPLSPAAEVLLAALALPATLVLAGLFPFRGLVHGARLAPVGALILLLAVLPLFPEGLAHWRSAYAGWLVLGAFVAAWRADWPAMLAAAGLSALGCGGAVLWWPGALLTVIASLLSLRREPWLAVSQRPGLLAAAGCGVAALGATLGVEVVYSVLMVVATVVTILRTPLPAGDPSSC